MPTRAATLITDQLARRPRRWPDYPAENRALATLGRELSRPQGNVLALLADLAMELCHAHTAGISLLESEGHEKVFRWHAVSGQWARFTGGRLPRHQCPCGVVVDRNATQLMHRPGRDFPLVAAVEPEPVEALLSPFHFLDQPVGTVWVLAHDESRKFDAEDVRLVEGLASFAATAYVVRDNLRRAEESNDELRRANARLVRTVERLSEHAGQGAAG